MKSVCESRLYLFPKQGNITFTFSSPSDLDALDRDLVRFLIKHPGATARTIAWRRRWTEKVRAIVQRLRALERLGLVYATRESKVRWFVRSRVVARWGFADGLGKQAALEWFL